MHRLRRTPAEALVRGAPSPACQAAKAECRWKQVMVGGVASASCRQPSALILRRHSRVKPTGYRPFHLLPPAVSGSAFPRVSKMTLLTRTKIRNSTNPMRSRTSPNEAITPPRPKPFRLRGRRARDRARRPAALPRSTWWPLTTGRRSSAFNSFDWIPDARSAVLLLRSSA